jgi:hypothetical protein
MIFSGCIDEILCNLAGFIIIFVPLLAVFKWKVKSWLDVSASNWGVDN